MKNGKFYFAGLEGSCEYHENDRIYHGKILNINGLVTYESTSEKDLFLEFKKAVEEYRGSFRCGR